MTGYAYIVADLFHIGHLNADVVISDSSTMIYEAWALGKPVVFCDWPCR